MKKVAMLHTSCSHPCDDATADRRHHAGGRSDALVEESMIKQVKAGGVSPNIAARIADYVHIAERRTAISLLPPALQLVLRWSNASL